MWEQEAGMASFNVYRGRLRALSDGNHDGALDTYGTCMVENSPSTEQNDSSIPPVGDGYIYLVSGNGAGGESGFGSASNNIQRPNAFPCATTVGKPQIVNVTLTGGDQESLAFCDWTQVLKGLLCINGIPANQFAQFPVVFLGVGYGSGRLEALVLDPDSTPAQNDIAGVTSQYMITSSGYIQSVPLLDDGSTLVSPQMQYFQIPEGCSSEPVCPACNPATYVMRSGDMVSQDDHYSKTLVFVSSQVAFDSPLGVTVNSRMVAARDCIMQSTQAFPWVLARAIGDSISFDIEAVDRLGFITWSPDHPSMPYRKTHFGCYGDDCGCCLLFSDNPGLECKGRSGLVGVPGSGYEPGLCGALF
jgi:hypothetical protein